MKNTLIAIGATLLIALVIVSAIVFWTPATTPTEVPNNQNINTENEEAVRALLAPYEWNITSITDARGVIPLAGVYRFIFVNGQLGGRMCNTLIAPFRIVDDPAEMRFTLLQRSKMLCSAPEMRPEEALVQSMKEGFGIAFADNNQRLVLIGTDTGFQFTFARGQALTVATSTQ